MNKQNTDIKLRNIFLSYFLILICFTYYLYTLNNYLNTISDSLKKNQIYNLQYRYVLRNEFYKRGCDILNVP